MNMPARARLTGKAARFLSMLHDFGHLDQAALDGLLVEFAKEGGADGAEVVVDLPEVRQAVACLLFERHPVLDEGPDSLIEDWPLLFF